MQANERAGALLLRFSGSISELCEKGIAKHFLSTHLELLIRPVNPFAIVASILRSRIEEQGKKIRN